MWTRERPFAAVAFATSSRIQTDRNERRLKDEYREREERGGTVPPLTLPRGGGGEKRWESGQIVPFDPPRSLSPAAARTTIRKFAGTRQKGVRGEDRAHPVRLLAPLLEKERSSSFCEERGRRGERDGWPRNTSLKGR